MTDIAREKAVIDSAPILHLEQAPVIGRCHFCGQLARELSIVEAHQYESGGQFIRYRGECCNAQPSHGVEE